MNSPFTYTWGMVGQLEKFFDSLTNLWIRENVKCLECHTEGVQDLHHIV